MTKVLEVEGERETKTLGFKNKLDSHTKFGGLQQKDILIVLIKLFVSSRTDQLQWGEVNQ